MTTMIVSGMITDDRVVVNSIDTKILINDNKTLFKILMVKTYSEQLITQF